MSARNLSILLPPSKGKVNDVGASGPPYLASLNAAHPLTIARHQVFAAVSDGHRTLSSKAQLRLYGVGEAVREVTRAQIDALGAAPTRPARERYHGVVYTNAGLADTANDHPNVHVYIVSALLGIAELDTAVPNYRLEFGASLPNFGSLARFWAAAVAGFLTERLHDTDVWNLLPNEHRSILSEIPALPQLIDVKFVTPAGALANAARTKVAKGQIVQTLRRNGPMSVTAFAASNPLKPGWDCHAEGNRLTAVCRL